MIVKTCRSRVIADVLQRLTEMDCHHI